MLPFFLLSQDDEHCANHIILNLVSLNFEAGCDFNDFGSGIDAAIQIFDLSGNILIENEVENLIQVTGPDQNVPFDLSSNSDCCNNGYSQTLGIFPIDEILFSFFVEIYDNDGGCCDGYQAGQDDNYGGDQITINIIDEVTGTIDVGSCISFNYELDITPIYEYGRSEFIETVCQEFSIEFNDIEYNLNNPSGRDTIYGGSANGCDSFINVQLSFYDAVEIRIEGDSLICFDETDIISVQEIFESYNWSNGSSDSMIEITGPGIYSLTVTDDQGCTGQDVMVIDYHPDFFPEFEGPTEFCEGFDTTLGIVGNFESYNWSNGETGNQIIVNQSGEYFVTVVNEEGCETINSVFINEVSLAEPVILGDTIFCFDGSTILTVEGNFLNYLWSNGQTSSSIVVSEPGFYQVSVYNALGCENENFISVLERDEYIERDTFYACYSTEVGQDNSSVISPEGCQGRRIETTLLYAPIPNYEVSYNQTIISGLSATLFLYLDNPNQAQIDWYDSEDVLICSGCSEIEVSPNETTSYYVIVDYHPECEIRENIEVNVKSNTNIYIPNVFSPDLEANNVFQIFGPDVENILQFNIYDRWGNLVFEDKGIDALWNGRRNGLQLENGVYVYLIEVVFYDGTSKILVGDVTLIE